MLDINKSSKALLAQLAANARRLIVSCTHSDGQQNALNAAPAELHLQVSRTFRFLTRATRVSHDPEDTGAANPQCVALVNAIAQSFTTATTPAGGFGE